MNTKPFRFLAVLGVFCFAFIADAAQESAPRPLLHPLFSDHAILQRGVKVPVWGWAMPGDKVTVRFAGKTERTVAQDDGRWMVHFSSLKASSEPRELSVTNSTSHESTSIKDVLVGDVWLCSGQSNMEMGIGACNASNDIAQANFPQIRLVTVPHRIAFEPQSTFACRWLPCTPDNVMQGTWAGFSAVGFFFGRQLHQELKVPIGLINSSWGGTVAEAWTSYGGLTLLPDMAERLAQFDAAKVTTPESLPQRFEMWYGRNDPGTALGWFRGDFDMSAWKEVKMPQPWEQVGLPDFDGIAWFRREFKLPPAWEGKDLTLSLGQVDDMDTTWVNGVKVGQMNRVDLQRVYEVPSSLVRTGLNTIAIRVLDTGGLGGLIGKPDQLHIGPTGAPPADTLSLAGDWRLRDSIALTKLPAAPMALDTNNPNVTTVLFNGMIAPLLRFAIKGTIWYQGESNAGRAAQYRRLLPALILDWRRQFTVGDFPFYIVQLAAYQAVHPEPRDDEWAELREAQAMTAKVMPHSGLAVAVDIGDAKDIHPKNKQEVGRRLALCALAETYGKKVEYSGPWCKAMKITGAAIHLAFDHMGGGLVAKGGKLTGFTIAGEDAKFVRADAVIQGSEVVVYSPDVPKPVAVRYAWDINPECNLYNKAGLPAVPFRTDDWPMLTRDRK
jgi:sialate O-acetylesterase